MPGAFQDKVVVITGASRGIGKVIALAFADEGADLVICARDAHTFGLPQVIQEVVDLVRAKGRRCIGLTLDVAKEEDARALFDAAIKEYGHIDIMVNNAGLAAIGQSFFEGDGGLATLDQAYLINVRTPFLLAQLAALHMAERGGGTIVNISSPSALHPHQRTTPTRPGMAIYGTLSYSYGITKAAMDRTSTTLAAELKEKNIAILNLHPGGTVTERIQAMGHVSPTMETPEMSAQSVLFLCKDPMTYTGQIIAVRPLVEEHNLV